MSAPALAARGLSLAYPGGPPVLQDLDLELAPGEFLAVVGPSGVGKSTLLQALAGLLVPDSGTLELPEGPPGLVFQRPRLLPWCDVTENALFGLEAQGRGGPEARARARELLQEMGLGEALDQRPHELSQGMRQRVNLARALLVEPRVLLLDEPFSALDQGARRGLQDELLRRWRAQGLSVLLVSHSLEEVAALADRVVALGGRPARVVAEAAVGLPRPRRADPEGCLAHYRRVEELARELGA